MFGLLAASWASFSLLSSFILSELRRRGGTGGGVLSTEDSENDGDGIGLLKVWVGTTGGGERYGGGCLDKDGMELKESMEGDSGAPATNEEKEDE